MSRRRYLSSRISQDPRINRLAIEGGDFAALLYTWLIPHAEDDASLPADPEELLMAVVPGRRDKTADDVAAALRHMLRLGVLEPGADARRLRFPESFYDYQSYIRGDRRKTAHAPQPSRDTEAAAQNSAEQRTSAQNGASFSFSSSSSGEKESFTTPVDRGPGREADASAQPPLREAVPKPSRTAKATERVAAVEAALKAEGMSGELTDKDERAIRKSRCPPEELARLYAAIFNGLYGDSFLQTNLSVALCLERLPGWRSHQQGNRAPPRERPAGTSASSRIDAVFKKAFNGHPPGRELDRERGRPQLGVQEARGRVPPQLPG